jgi:hypothetical protein
MNVLMPPPAKTVRIEIDTECLLRQISSLNQVSKQLLNWNEFGEEVARDFIASPEMFRVMSDDQVSREAPAPSLGPSKWVRAKNLVHGVFTREDPNHIAIRKRLFLSNPSTSLLLQHLSLWLAGKLGLSVTATRPMVAVILYAVAKSPLGWEILRDDEEVSVGAVTGARRERAGIASA